MMNISLKPLVLIVLILTVAMAYVATATNSPAVRPAPRGEHIEQLAEELESSRSEKNIPGMVVVVVKDDEIVFLKGFGHADLEQRKPVTDQTVFAIGSASKAMTAALIGLLVEDEKMDWDDPIRKHLPKFAIGDEETADQVTIRDLLSHRTGLGRNDMLWASGQADPERILLAASHAKLRKPFRSAFQYSNVSYLAAGETSARAAGTTWERLIHERLFQPLGMESASISFTEIGADRLALGYEWREDREQFRLRPMRSVANCAPAGAVNATALDMAQWLRFQLARGTFDGKQIAGREIIEETWTGQIELAPGIEYGLGWFVRDWQGRTLIEHGGNIDGFASQVALLPEENIGFAIMMNVTFTAMQWSSIPTIFSAFIDVGDDEDHVFDPEELERYLGEYEFAGFEGPANALVRDGRLALDVPGQMVYDLRPPDEDGKWRFAIDPNIAVSFNRDEDDFVISMTLYQAGLEMEMPRVGVERPAEVSRDEVAPYLGTYRFDVLQNDVEVLIENGRLAVDVPGQMVYELHTPDEEGQWRFRATDSIAVRFNRDEEDRVDSMTMFQAGMVFELPKVADSGAAAGVTVKDLLRRMREAYGTEHLDALGPVRLTGEVEMSHQGVDGTTLIFLDGPERSYEVTDLGVFGRIMQATGDEVAWTIAFDEEPDILRGRYRDQMVLMNPLLLAADWEQRFDEVNYLRQEENNEGRTTHVLQVHCGDDVRMTVHVDDESAYVVRQQLRMMLRGMGSIPVTLRLGDYRRVNGVAVPHRYELDNEFAGLVVYRVTKAETDIKLPEGMFDPPPNRKSTTWLDPITAAKAE